MSTKLAAAAAETIWEGVDLDDCRVWGCPKWAKDIRGRMYCTADGPKRCPTTRKSLWALQKSIVEYYTSASYANDN